MCGELFILYGSLAKESSLRNAESVQEILQLRISSKKQGPSTTIFGLVSMFKEVGNFASLEKSVNRHERNQRILSGFSKAVWKKFPLMVFVDLPHFRIAFLLRIVVFRCFWMASLSARAFKVVGWSTILVILFVVLCG